MFLILIILVLKNNPNRRANRVAALVFTAFLIWGIAEMMQRFTTESEPDFARLTESIYGVGVLLVGSSLLHLSLVFPKIRAVPKWVIPIIYAGYIPMLAIMFATNLFIDSMKFSAAGWEAQYGPFVGLYFGYTLVLALTSIIVMLDTYRKSTMTAEKDQVRFFIIGLMVGISFIFCTHVLPTAFDRDVITIMPTTSSLLIFSLFILYSILKYKMFTIEAVTEESIEATGSEIPVEKGFTHIVEEKGMKNSYQAFRGLVSTTPGLCLSTSCPDKVRSSRNLGKTPIIWLTESTSSERALNPWRLDFEISYTVKNFMEENPETVIMIDDLEYLGSLNGFEKMVDFVKGLNDTASINNSTVIAPVNPSAFEPEKYHILAGAFDKKLQGKEIPSPGVDTIREGASYLVTSEKMPEAIGKLKQYVQDHPALCLTKMYPEKFVKMHDMSGVKIYWLTDAQQGEEKYISPSRLDFELTGVVSEFAKGEEKRTVILDGLENLIQANGFKRTLDYIKYSEDVISSKNGVFLVSVEEGSLKPEQMAMLEKRFDHVIV
jgi:archaellum biogenesis ATPase FlaH